MKITTEPAGRFAWRGQTVHYVVKAEGASEVSLPEKCPDGLQARITGLRQVDGGVEADLSVEVRDPVFV